MTSPRIVQLIPRCLSGLKRIPKIGRMPRVKKKFQWTPYSVTCSYSISVGSYHDKLTG